MLILNAELHAGRLTRVRIRGTKIVEVDAALVADGGEQVIDAAGASLLPGLHDHHIHLASLAAWLDSVPCGPPGTQTAEALADRLGDAAAAPADDDAGWIRGVGYHESVAGEIDRDWLDRIVPRRPLRIQHRSGRLWILNSCALERLGGPPGGAGALPGERVNGWHTGRLYDADSWLRVRLGGRPPALAPASRLLASFGITGVTDATPHNGREAFDHFLAESKCGSLLQEVVVMGAPELVVAPTTGRVRAGARKIHHHDADLPSFDSACADIRTSHAAGRPVAFHCVTLTELVFCLTALAEAGCLAGDRIEHASVTSPEALALIAGLKLTVVTQPNFVRERGDVYLADVAASEQAWLYRLRSFIDAGVALGGGSDAPFGGPNPWLAMEAAVRRRTLAGTPLGADEALRPDEALALFITAPDRPGGALRRVEPGALANICLLDRPWAEARQSLADVRVAATIREGECIWP